jgi:tetratricopeptide (TPR) repeat protein
MLFDARGRIVGVWLAIAAVTALFVVAVRAEPGAAEPPAAAADDDSPPAPVESGDDEPESPPAEEPTPAEPTPAELPPAEAPSADTPVGGAKPDDDDAPPEQPVEASPENAAELPPESAAPDAPPEPATSPDEEGTAADAPAKLPDVDRAEPTPITPQTPVVRDRGGKGEAGFLGVRPGHTTRQALHDKWGAAKQVDKIPGGVRETFQLQDFDKVRVTVLEDVVDSLAIQLEKPVAQKSMVERLDLDQLEPVDVLNDQGRLVGQAYPERGVMFGFVQKSKPLQVFQIVVEPIDAQPFLDRAQARLETRFADCVSDLKRAIELAPNATRPRWLHAELTLRAGDLEQALQSAERIVEQEPNVFEYRLTLAKVLAASGDYAQAVKHASAVAERGKPTEVVAARAHCQWGDYLAAGETHNYEQAIKHQLQAIKLAEPLVASPIYAVRRAAKELMVDAHLAVAYDIGWGRWQQKSGAIAKWIERATVFADDLVAHERTSRDVQLRVHERALAALAGVTRPPDGSKWVQGATTLGKQMVDDATDAAYKSHLAWRLGVAMNDAVEVEATRQKLDRAVELGKLGLDYFDAGEQASKQQPAHDYLRGRLCYRLGAVFAIQKSEHERAIVWFDQAVPLLEHPVPASVVDSGKQGETFVSMAVSYWETGNRREGLRLTNQGVRMMQAAADEGLLEKSALAIPYGNLASMHEQLGDGPEAKKFSELASRYEAPAKQ